MQTQLQLTSKNCLFKMMTPSEIYPHLVVLTINSKGSEYLSMVRCLLLCVCYQNYFFCLNSASCCPMEGANAAAAKSDAWLRCSHAANVTAAMTISCIPPDLTSCLTVPDFSKSSLYSFFSCLTIFLLWLDFFTLNTSDSSVHKQAVRVKLKHTHHSS